MNPEERARVAVWLELTSEFMTWLIRNGHFIAQELMPDFLAALELLPLQTNAAQSAVISGQYDSSLEAVGLSGAGLRLKASTFKRALRRFVVSPVVRRATRTLESADNFLNSFKSAIPLGEPIFELKETLLSALREFEDDHDPNAKSERPMAAAELSYFDSRGDSL